MAQVRQSLMLNPEQLEELHDSFNTIDADGNGFISVSELGQALKSCGYDLPGYRIRDLITEYDSKIKDSRLDFDEFQALYARLKADDVAITFKKQVTKREGIETIGGTSVGSTAGTTHSVRQEEQVAFSNWINRNLSDDPDCARYLPINPESKDLYNRCKDGIILCKLINKSQPGTIDERAINKTNLSVFRITENLTLALNSASSIGCNIVNIGADDLNKGKPHLLLGLLWQIIRIGLLSDINLHEHPGLAVLLEEGESLEDFMKLSPEEILIRWVNYHLRNSNCGRQISNFSGDIKDSVAYIHLLHQISPRDKGVTTLAENEHDLEERAERMLQESDKIGCRQFVSPTDVVSGNPKLNLAFVANLFNTYPGLEKMDDLDLGDIHEETREEKTYRNWMNSMGVSPYVNNVYNDLQTGLIIFQLYDIIKPGCVNWSRVHKKFHKLKAFMEKLENCNYVVELGKECKFSLVGIQGKDIQDGNETLTLAVVWQLMRAYTLSILAKLAGDEGHMVAEKEIVSWVNDKLKSANKKSSIRSFQDPTIANARVLLDLIDSLKPGSINYDLVKMGNSEAEQMDNSKYAISMARKIGARVYALPEDIAEVKSKMVMTVFACLMIKDFEAGEKRVA